jgi:hypothetical protein
VPLFTRRKELGVQSFILKLVNNHCSELEALIEGPRLEHRAHVTVVVLVIPIENGRPHLAQMFSAVTKEIATAGLSLVLDEPKAPDEVLLGFRWESQMHFIRAQAMHLSPMGAGFYQLGLRMSEMVRVADYPELSSVSF